ncbi:uncharacterized protein N7515_008948 [Penicillium bovifimosum]|uniref:Hemerythrin-like domain-containing protein n=1 Tax=Penicillium bovifimosum TaxID=126998 RepID=A0A9W9GJQ8_9EURO|nr:uncharacterized protein N7515_008948 [Penicillium bovifimosum]KAJ5120987.1 hypothetical protein N7515_008948 [Penicillium bovifimosum]
MASSSSASSGDLPPLSASDFRTYNRMAEHMEAFHSHFRLTWNQLSEACGNSGKRGLSARQMIMMGLQFCAQLNLHHNIEEQHIFPVLAKKMPEFRKNVELLSQHKQIHAGLEKLEKYLEQCQCGEEDLRREEVKRLMEGFEKVLWVHLDQEVETLGAANMRKFWSLDEMRRLPM